MAKEFRGDIYNKLIEQTTLEERSGQRRSALEQDFLHAATPEFPYHVFNRDPPFRVCGHFETLSALRGCLSCTPDFDGTTREGRFLQQHC